ncbi:hypothetical protein V1318_18525 [Lysobacter sp. CCNWLW3]|uniref:hypothetical protein n=1 Tax=unclassified Lysobacter TaxID=2635362 RepID=UPI002FD74C6D
MSRAIVAGLVAAASLTACSSLSPYPFQPGEPSAVVNLSDVPSPFFCVGGTNYKFVPDKQQRARVPVGKRIAVNSFVYIGGYQSYWTCTAGMSFVPDAGHQYLVNLEMRDQACRLEVYREGADNRVGLDLEPSFDRPYCPR